MGLKTPPKAKMTVYGNGNTNSYLSTFFKPPSPDKEDALEKMMHTGGNSA